MSRGDDADRYAHHMRAVAAELCGEPNKQLSSKTELRFGKQGSLSVHLDRGVWNDHEQGNGGGVLALIERFTGRAGPQAVEWMRERGYDVGDDRPAPAPAARQTGGPRLDPAGNWLPQRVPDHGRLTATYDYRDASGALSYQVCRFEWEVDPSVNPKGREKTFVQRVPDARKPGGWSYSTKGITWLPYRLPELLEDIASGYTIFIAEGEKKVDMLREIGVPATTNHGGAGKFPEDLAAHFAGARVVVLPDNDPAGAEHAALIGRRLEGVAADVSTLALPGLPPKGGVDDWIPAGGTAERLYDLVEEAAQPLAGAPFVSQFQAVQWRDLDAPGPAHEYLVKGVLTDGEMSLLLGESQSGKSFLAIDIAMAVARGEDFFRHRVRRGAVIYQAGESATGVRRKRLPAYRIGHGVTDPDLPFVLLQGPLDLYGGDDPTEAFIDECLYWAKRSRHPLKLIVIDTFNKATPGANENDGRDMGSVLARCDLIRRKTGAHVMLVHHLNAGGNKARGHTSLFANVENVITVKRIEDSHDADRRGIREWKIAKQKDGEDGTATKFVLRGVKIGTDADGEEVFSCVVAPPNAGDGQDAPSQEGISIGGFNAVILRAVYTAIKTKGVLAPADLSLARGALAVTRRDLAEVIRAATVDDDDPTDIKEGETAEDAKRRRQDAIRKKVARARDLLFQKDVIGLNEEWCWLKGKRVVNFETPPGLGEDEAQYRRRSRRRDDPADEAPAPRGGPPIDLPFIDAEDFR